MAWLGGASLGVVGHGDAMHGEGFLIRISVPVRTQSELNTRGHWASRAQRFKKHRVAVRWAWRNAGVGESPKLPICVTLVRIAPRRMDDDNLAGSMKAVRDEVAACLGIDDGDPGVTWVYQQEKGLGPGRYEVVIQVEEDRDQA